MTLKQVKMAWGLLKPLLASVGITKTQDLQKYTKPLLETVEKLVKLEAQQTTAAQDIAASLRTLAQQRDEIELVRGKTMNVRTQLEQVLRDN